MNADDMDRNFDELHARIRDPMTPELIQRFRWQEINELLPVLAEKLTADGHRLVYGIPRAGQVIAGLLLHHGCIAVDTPEEATAFVDDVIDSGETSRRWFDEHGKNTYPLFNKNREVGSGWVIFPWEDANPHVDASDHVARLLEVLGQDVTSEGLRDTPRRVVALYQEMTIGERQDIRDILSRTFTTESDEIVTVRDIPYYSLCEHHLMPFFGTITVGYLPDRADRTTHRGPYRVLGLSKLARLVYAFSRRLQLQERMTWQIANALHESKDLRPQGVGVLVRGHHLCMKMRGVRSDGEMVTSALLGMFRDHKEVRAEWLALSRGGK